MFSGQAIEDFEISIHALREEGDLLSSLLSAHFGDFYPRPPRGGRPGSFSCTAYCAEISIHALREEGDNGTAAVHLYTVEFLSTPSARRATGTHLLIPALQQHFYPRPPRGGRRTRASYLAGS